MGQLKDFKSLFIGGEYTPSDIDVCYQLNAHGLIIVGELKLAGVEVPAGQMIMLRDIVNTYLLAGKRAMLFIAEHVTHPSEDIDCLLYTSPSPRDGLLSRMPSSA